MSQIILETRFQKEFYKHFERLTVRQDRRKVWDDFITISQSFLDTHKLLGNETLPAHITNFYHNDEWKHFSQMFQITMEALEWNPDQDFLGGLYMRLGLSNHSRGEEFTPYALCRGMASISARDIEKRIEEKGWASVYDPACGAGATMIAFANECFLRKIDFQKHILFVAQDIGWAVAGMCFIQLSLLGCGGYVIVGDTLKSPFVGASVLHPFQQKGQEIWYTPTYYLPPWSDRVMVDTLENLTTPHA